MRTSQRDVALAALALAVLLSGAEGFLRFAESAPLKIVSVLFVSGGVAALGWPLKHRGSWLPKALAIVVFLLYIGQAAWRYPGLLKEPPPLLLSDVVALCTKVAAVLVLTGAMVNLLVRGIRRAHGG